MKHFVHPWCIWNSSEANRFSFFCESHAEEARVEGGRPHTLILHTHEKGWSVMTRTNQHQRQPLPFGSQITTEVYDDAQEKSKKGDES